MTIKQKTKDLFNAVRTNQTILVCILLTFIYMLSGYCKWIEIAVSVCAIVFLAILPLQKAFCIFAYLHCFTLSNIGYDSCFMVTLIGFCIILLVKYCIGLKKGTYKFHKSITYTISLLMLFSIIISIPQKLYSGAWLYLTYFPFFYFMLAMRKEFNIAEAMNYMFGGLVASAMLAIVALVLPAYQYYPFMEGRFIALINHPNYLYMRALFILCYYMYRYLSNNLSHLKFASCYLICAILTLATISKTGIAMLALITIAFVVLYLKDDFKSRIKVVGIFLIVVAVISLISIRFIISVFKRFADVDGNVINSLLTGRGDIWVDYLKACVRNPFVLLFGNGLLTQECFIVAQGRTRASHNLYIFLLYRFGIVGCIVLGYIAYKFIKILNCNKPKFIAYIPLLYLLIESMCDNTFKCYNFTYFAFAFMILFMNCKEKTIPNNIVVEKTKKQD